jgi:hypothetical protein
VCARCVAGIVGKLSEDQWEYRCFSCLVDIKSVPV